MAPANEGIKELPDEPIAPVKVLEADEADAHERHDGDDKAQKHRYAASDRPYHGRKSQATAARWRLVVRTMRRLR